MHKNAEQYYSIFKYKKLDKNRIRISYLRDLHF